MHYVKLAATSAAAIAAACLLSYPGSTTTHAQSTRSTEPSSRTQTAKAEPSNAPVLARHADVQSKEAAFAMAHPGTRIGTWQGYSSIYGRSFAHGPNARAAAESFRVNQLPLLGVNPEELKPYARFLPAEDNTVGLMYNRATDTYKFTALYYTQERDGLEVYGSRMTLLTRNEANHPLVLADLAVRDMGPFHVTNTQKENANPQASVASALAVLGRNAHILVEPKQIIWAGVEDMKVAPALAFEVIGEGGDIQDNTYRAKRFITDAATGDILFEEDLLHDVDVVGNVSGMATTGHGADLCGGIAAAAMPYARVGIGGNFVFADVDGNFVIPNAGASDVVVDAEVRGQYFRVVNSTTGGGNSTLSQSVTPPGPANFMFNAANDTQYKRAEVNAYVHANKVRDMVLEHHPTFPSIANETNFVVNVNINTTCNAFYSSANQTINFYVSGGANNCTNTANSTVVHHEYGHRIVNAAGSGQGAYGEGYADCIAVILTDQSCLGQGFSPSIETTPCSTGFASCSGCLRDANNNSQYQTTGCSSCGSAIHSCGRLISGCVWSTRNYLAAAFPATYLDTIRSLTINSSLLHTGTTITPQITIHFLTLDDDDDDINNGTPHYNQINAGFTDHNMPGPVLNPFSINATPSDASVCAPADAVVTINIDQVGTNTNPVTLSVDGVPAGATAQFSVNPVTPGGSSVLTIGNTGGAATGPATLVVTGTQGQIGLNTNVGLHISNGAPGTVGLLSPADGSIDVPVVPTLSWNADGQAQSYLLQVATDSAFSNVVYSANVAGTSHVLGSALNTLTVYRWRVKASNGCGEGSFSSTYTFRTMSVPAILLVDDDDNSPNVQPYYTAALNAMGLTYDIWDTGNTSQNEPTYNDLAAYKIIIWFSGDSFGGTGNPKAGPKAVTDVALQQWLDEGGCLYLVSQDYLYDRIGSGNTTPNAYMQEYLGIADPFAHDRNYVNITGGFNLFAGFSPWTLTYSTASGGPGLSNFSDLVNPNANALLAFTFQTASASGGGAITRDGGKYRTSFWGFPFEAIPTAGDRLGVMSTIISWCGQLNLPCPADITGDGQVNANDLLTVINAWGACPASPELCPADITQDEQVNANDLLAVINGWGECP